MIVCWYTPPLQAHHTCAIIPLQAPCIIFIDEFDGLGKSRSYSGVGDDESVHTINQLLTEMDGFEDNTGVVVMAATNRPASLDKALIRPGRFDRIVHLPLPNLDGRVGILQVHCRNKTLAQDVDLRKIARAAAGFTGAELMNLVNTAAVISVRQGHGALTDADLFEALELQQQEKVSKEGGGMPASDDDIVPPALRRSIAVYEAAKVLVAHVTPHFDEIAKVTLCPGGAATAFTYFVPSEEHIESGVVSRGYMEARLVVAMAGRCAERLVLGDGHISMGGAADLEMANNIAREMVYRFVQSWFLCMLHDDVVLVTDSVLRENNRVLTCCWTWLLTLFYPGVASTSAWALST